MTTVCLSMIVRDEAHVIERCLRSVNPYVTSWYISDTGSKDATGAIVTRELSGIPGELAVHKWRDFSTNRNLALAGARRFGTDYILVIDADEELVMPPGADFSSLTASAYSCRFRITSHHDGRTWYRKLLVRGSDDWRYHGVIHECLISTAANVADRLGDVMVLSHHDSARNRDPKKFLRDARVLRREIRKNPKNTRDWFYYAQCLASAGKIDGAIEAYRQRVRLGDGPNPEEVFFSLYQVAALRGWRGESWMDVARAYLEAFQVRPTRAEPLWALASLHREHRELNLAELYARKACSLPKPDGDLLFVDNSVYDWRAADVLAGVLAEMGRLAESRGILERMLQQPSLIGDERGRVRTNLDIVTQKLAA